MALTPQQLPTLKAAIAAETDSTFVSYRDSGATGAMADWYNQPHDSVKGWNKSAPWGPMYNSIDGAKYTPSSRASRRIEIVPKRRWVLR